MHTINNNKLQISVKPIGAELCSIKSLKSNKEFLWDANPNVWGSHSPILFPIIGRLKNGKYLYKNKEYSLPLHGFVRGNSEIKLKEKTDTSLSFSLTSSEKTLEIYPFEFEFITKYSLQENKLTIRFEVINLGDDRMLFSVGGHPGFKCPINKGDKYEDYYLEFEKPETASTHEVDKNGLIDKGRFPILENSKIINLTRNTFDNEALIFKSLKSTTISLKSRAAKEKVVFNFKEFPYLGIWAMPKSDFVCFEPWHGMPDFSDTDGNFETKKELIKLAPNNTFSVSYSIEIFE